MAILRTRAIILRHSTDREYDRQLVVFSPDYGQLRLRARGTKKSVSKLGGSLEPLAEVDLTLANGRTVDVVTGSIILDRFTAIRSDIVSFISAQWLLELIERVTKPNHANPGLYGIIRQELQAMAAEKDWSLGRRWLVLLRRAWRILDHEGFAPALDRCGRCHQTLAGPATATYEATHGFIHQAESNQGLNISSATRVMLQHGRVEGNERQLFSELRPIVESLIHHTLDRPLRSERVLRSVFRQARLSDRQ